MNPLLAHHAQVRAHQPSADRAGGLKPRTLLRGFGLSALIPCAALLYGCDVAADQRIWTDCVSARTGERVQVIDNWQNRPHAKDARGYVFRIETGQGTDGEWRCRPAPGARP